LAVSNRGYRPVSYHVGGVWPHDTAIAVAGLVEASEHFRHRLPELFSGFDRSAVGFPAPYPNAASPQAWSAASVLLLLRVLLGLEPGAGGDLRVRPILNPDALPLRLEGIVTGRCRRVLLVEAGRAVRRADFRLTDERHDVGAVVVTRPGMCSHRPMQTTLGGPT
jgi:hypothetical protein